MAVANAGSNTVSIRLGVCLNTYTVTYDGNGNTGGTAPVDPKSPYTVNSTVTVLGPGSLTKTGYAFNRWNTAANGTGTSYSTAATFSITSDTTLYAQWTNSTPISCPWSRVRWNDYGASDLTGHGQSWCGDNHYGLGQCGLHLLGLDGYDWDSLDRKRFDFDYYDRLLELW